MADRTVVLSQNGRHAVRGLSVNNPSEFSAYQDDDDDLTYVVDLSAYLDGDTITVVTRVPQGVFISNSSNTTTRLTQRLRGFGYVDFKVQTSAGDVEEFRINILRRTGSKVVLGASGGGGTGVTPGDYGDISISAGNVWTIDPLAVTTAKIANQAVTFGKFQHIAQNEVVGRVAAGTGDTKALSANEVIDVVNAASNTVNFARLSGVQASDAELTAIAGLTSAADRLPYFTGSGTAALATFTAAGRALVDDADTTAQRATLGLGAIALRPDIVDADVNASAAIAPTKLAFTQAGTGASARTVDAKIKETISVKDFGAVGNGSTNDRTAFSDAFTAANGRPVTIPAGNYNIATAYAAPAGSSAIVESGVTFTGNTPTGIDWNPWEMNLTPVVSSKMGINYKWESSPFPFENEAGIWSDKTYAGYVFSKNFDSTTNPVNGYDNGPAAALFLKADSGSASTDSIGAPASGFEGATVGILAKSVLRASNGSAWAENLIARTGANTSGQKLVGTEIDVQPTSNEFMPLGSTATYSNSGGDLLLTHAYQDYATGTAVKLSEGFYFDKLPSSLTEWTTYYTIRNNATSSFLATTLANALANTRIAYTAPPAGGSGLGGYSVLAAKDVTFSNVSSKTLVSGIPSDWPDYTCVVFGSSGTLPDTVSGSTHPFYNAYWLVKQSSTTARLATSYTNAKANVTIANYTNSPSGTHHMYWQHLRSHAGAFIVGFNQPMSNAIQVGGHSGGSFSNGLVLYNCDNGVTPGAGASATNKNIMNSLINTGQYTTTEYRQAAIAMQSQHQMRFVGTDSSYSNAAKVYRDSSNDMRCVLPNSGKWRFLNAAENADNLTIDSNGRVGIGIDPTFVGGKLNVFGETQFEPSVVIRNSSNDANAAYLYFDKQKNGVGTGTLSDGDDLGTFRWRGAHLASFLDAAEIQVEADGSSNTNVMPSRIVFKTRSSTASASPAERMRINKDGYVGIGQTAISYPLDVSSNTANSSVARFTDGVAQTLTVKTDANGVLIGNENNGYISFTSNGERARVNSTGIVLPNNHGVTFSGTSTTHGRVYNDTSNDVRAVLGSGKLRFRNSADNADLAVITATSGGRFGLGIDPDLLGSTFGLYSTNQYEPAFIMRNRGDNAQASYMYFDKQRNSNQGMSDGDDIGTIRWRAFHTESGGAATVGQSAEIWAEVAGTTSPTSIPSRIVIATCASGSTTSSNTVIITPEGHVDLARNSSAELRVNGTKVVKARQTGWTAATGTATRTAFATSSVSTQDLAERVKALIDDLISHGLIGA